ncbi:MAG: type 1 glutamine amidotransferase-like domain-containing protein [Pirellulaceae bacterium]|nr:type 1 glutamine amidotransferase-like domain-containing protein [Pirellulaceae bacterium]
MGPPKGTLLLGGASPTTRIMRRFIELAGGREARIVVLPTADARHRERIHRDLALLRKLGATNVQLLHSIDRDTANSRAFVEPLRKADAAWILDGDPWRLADAYLHTLVHKELFDLLDRGGIVAGSGGGARFLAHHMSGDEYGWVRGCGLLKRSAVDTWPSDKRRIDQMVASLKNDRSLLGIGIDDKTALVVRGNRFESLGDGEVALFNAIPGGWPWEEDESHLLLEPGGRYDLETRRPEWMTEWPPAADRLFGRCLDDQNADL